MMTNTVQLSIVLAAALNGLEIIGKNIADVRLVVNGAGASAIACTLTLLRALGFKRKYHHV